MKKLSYLLLSFAAAMLVFAACEGPAGPAGAVGPVGPQGEQGIQGEIGEAGTTTCEDCHSNNQGLTARAVQWEASVHATGGHAARAGADCAPCHTSQGFVEANAAGEFAQATIGNGSTAADISNPNQPNCYTCHNIHANYAVADWLLTKTTATNAWHSNDGVTVGSESIGSGDMCTGCHQARSFSDVLDLTDAINTTDYTSPYAKYTGLHHGPQYNVYIAEGLYEFAGATTYPTSNHLMGTGKADNGCVTCHMTEPYGAVAGGHTFAMVYDDHGHAAFNWPASCVTCHSDAGIGQDLDLKMADIEAKVGDSETLGTLLGDLHFELDALGIVDGGYLGVGNWTDQEMGAYLNYRAIEEGGGKGMHNFSYTVALLENTLELLFGYDFTGPK